MRELFITKMVLFAVLLLNTSTVAAAPASADSLFSQNCASCHSEQLTGGLAGSLLDDEWTQDGSTATLTQIITEGITVRGMPAWGGTLSAEEVRSLIIYIQEQRHQALKADCCNNQDATALNSAGHSFGIETMYVAESILWALEYLPDDSMLATQRDGQLLHISASGQLISKIQSLPDIWHHVQGGLLDVTLHPDFEKNGWVYLAYAISKGKDIGAMAIARGRIKQGHWVDHQTIFEVEPKFYSESGRHFGARVVLQDSYAYFALGERTDRASAQDLGSPNGKIFRLHDDGRVPADNPFVGTEGALPGIWSYGHRNPQGMAIEQSSGLLWQVEHGPRGGDELNVITAGANYGWPDVTYGMNYDGTPITHLTASEGTVQPRHYWVPSISPAGMVFYTGDMFPQWRDKLLIGGLGIQDIQILTIKQGEVQSSDTILSNRGRIRDLSVAPDGSIKIIVTIDGKGHILSLNAL